MSESCIFCHDDDEDTMVCNNCADRSNWFGFTWGGLFYQVRCWFLRRLR